jgi:hypothetical protein
MGNAEKISALKNNHALFTEFLDKPFDLWVIGFAVIVGVVMSGEGAPKGKVAAPAIFAAICLILILASVGLSLVFSGSVLRIFIPDFLAVAFVAYTINRIKP